MITMPYQIVDLNTNGIAAGERYDLSLDDCGEVGEGVTMTCAPDLP